MYKKSVRPQKDIQNKEFTALNRYQKHYTREELSQGNQIAPVQFRAVMALVQCSAVKSYRSAVIAPVQ